MERLAILQSSNPMYRTLQYLRRDWRNNGYISPMAAAGDKMATLWSVVGSGCCGVSGYQEKSVVDYQADLVVLTNGDEWYVGKDTLA